MSQIVTPIDEVIIPADVTFAPTKPVLTAQHVANAATARSHQEFLTDAATPGNPTQTVTGHQHTGGGDGHSIPRQVWSECWAVPNSDESSVGPAYAIFGTRRSDLLLSNAHAPPGWVANVVGATITSYQILKFASVRLRAGCVGVTVRLWHGVGRTTSPPAGATPISGETVTVKVELATFALLDNSPISLVLDSCTKAYTADVDAQWVSTGGSGDDLGPSANGTEYLEVADGDALAVDTDVAIIVQSKCSTNANATVHYLFAAQAFEVMFEAA